MHRRRPDREERRWTQTQHTAATLNDGWHRLTVVSNGTLASYYVDQQPAGFGLASKTDVYAVGNQQYGHHRFGGLAGFALYNFAVEVTDLPDWSGN